MTVYQNNDFQLLEAGCCTVVVIWFCIKIQIYSRHQVATQHQTFLMQKNKRPSMEDNCGFTSQICNFILSIALVQALVLTMGCYFFTSVTLFLVIVTFFHSWQFISHHYISQFGLYLTFFAIFMVSLLIVTISLYITIVIFISHNVTFILLH